MKLLLTREDLADEIATVLDDTNDIDVNWAKFAEAVVALLEQHGVTFIELGRSTP